MVQDLFISCPHFATSAGILQHVERLYQGWVVSQSSGDCVDGYKMLQAKEVTLILVDSLVANPVVRLAFEDPASLAFDSVSGRSGTQKCTAQTW